MSALDNLSHVYKGLLLRNRAFASFKNDELELINSDIQNHIKAGEWILDPMSGYGGGMMYFGAKGYKTYNIEINPPAYYWQLLINPLNKEILLKIIESIVVRGRNLPSINDKFSVSEELFTKQSISLIAKIYQFIFEISKDKEIAIALLLPFVARFANYQKSSSNITHFIQGGFCSFEGWKNDFIEYLHYLRNLINKLSFKENQHIHKIGNIFDLKIKENKFDFFVTSPPYPNYRDYSKLFKIENWILDNLFYKTKTDFNQMIGSNNVSGKKYDCINSENANNFLNELLNKSKKLSKKSGRDVVVYYHPYFSLYFYNMQEAYRQLNEILSPNSIGYLVVNDNITRDIPVPVGKATCDFFMNMGYEAENYNEAQISHFGNIGKLAKRINSRHTRHILKVWKK